MEERLELLQRRELSNVVTTNYQPLNKTPELLPRTPLKGYAGRIPLEELSTLRPKVILTLRARYRIRAEDAEDIIQEGITTYLGVHQRYDEKQNHQGILVGIIFNKALEYLGRQTRGTKLVERYSTKIPLLEHLSPRYQQDEEEPVIEEVIKKETAQHLLTILQEVSDELPLKLREIYHYLLQGTPRTQAIATLGINRNTYDTRLRSIRKKIRKKLTKND